MIQSITLCKNIDASKVSFTKMDNIGNNFLLSYPQYNNKPFILQSPTIKVMNGCIHVSKTNPYANPFMIIAIDPKQSNCLEFENGLSNIDQFVINNKDKIFGNAYQQIQFEPIIKTPISHDDCDDPKNKKQYLTKPKMKYCKMHFDINYQNKIQTKIIVKSHQNKSPTHLNSPTMEDINSHLALHNEVRAIFMISKLLLHDPSHKTNFYLKLLALEITVQDTKLQSFDLALLENMSDEIDDTDKDDENDEDDFDNFVLEICI